jgi:nitronate monooxygenase
MASGAAGIQVGTAFALCADSGLRPDYRRALLDRVAVQSTDVLTDPVASPTGFPFKVAALEGTLSDTEIYRARPRVCDLGYLREAYRTPDGEVGFRCPAEPVSVYVSKGGAEADTQGRKCICNALIANIGMAQRRGRTYVEPGLVTVGDDVNKVGRFLPPGQSDYTAADVIHALLAGHPG